MNKEILSTIKNNFNLYFIDVLKKQYFDYKGRAGLVQFWNYYLYSTVVSFLLGFIFGLLHLNAVAMIVALVFIIPGICIGIRRLHDLGIPGFWYLIAFIPVLGPIFLLITFSLPGEKKANAYGEAK